MSWVWRVAATVPVLLSGLVVAAGLVIRGVGFCNEDADLSAPVDCSDPSSAWDPALVGGPPVVMGLLMVWLADDRWPVVLGTMLAVAGAVAAWLVM